MIKKGLGKGLGALIATDNEDSNENLGVRELKINDIEPNINQPRKYFNDEKLLELADSIKQHGVVQPIIVRKENDTYKIVAGERRWRAARLAGINTVPVIIKELTNKQIMEIAIIENIQREDLNPIEEAEAYERLLVEYNMTQEEVSNVVGKSRSAVANSIRLNSLSETIKAYLVQGDLTSGHARALLSLEIEENRQKIAEEIIERKLNVRETENLVKQFLNNNEKKKVTNSEKEEDKIELIEIENKLKEILGTKVKLTNNNNKGKIMIEYYSKDELDRLLEIFNKISKNNEV